MSTTPEQHITKKTYFIIFAALMVLLVVTVLAAYIPFYKMDVNLFGRTRNLHFLSYLLALFIASVKAILVILYFMHVRHSTNLTKVFVFAGLFWLMILFGLTFSDYLSRSWLPGTDGWNYQVEKATGQPVRQVKDPTRATDH